MNDKSMASGTSAAARCAARADHRGVSRIDPVSATAYIAEMALRDILILPDKRLRHVSGPVKKIDAGVRKLVEDMFETMYDAPGIRLAAIQIGTPKLGISIDFVKKQKPRNPQAFRT